jgi:hypothetical protein
MKKIILFIVSMFLLISCSDLKGIIKKENTMWKTEDNLFRFYIEGPDNGVGSGMFNIDNQLIEVVIRFNWNTNKLECISQSKTNVNVDEIILMVVFKK